MSQAEKLLIRTLGECQVDSPVRDVALGTEKTPRFTLDAERILLNDHVHNLYDAPDDLASLELAGPRRRIFFDPAKTAIGIVTCGGLCPGLNDVIRGLVVAAHYRYGVKTAYGFRYGYRGFVDPENPPIRLDPELVSEIHEQGGSILRSSRGKQDTAAIVDCLTRLSINILYVIGGDGTLRGGLDISREIQRRGLKISVIGLPKTIDNDLKYIDRSFGFETAYTQAVEAIRSAHNEARGTLNGIGLVKVMGRHSGFLACNATLATSHVNFCLIPEMPFGANGGKAFLDALQHRLEQRQHAVVVVAEGTGQDRIPREKRETDASGNLKLIDIGAFLADGIRKHFDALGMEYSLKYIDPSYMVRSVPACPSDKVYCWRLAQNAIHAGMCGKTELVLGLWHGRFVHIPIDQAISSRNLVDTESDLWLSVLETTGQPAVME